MTKLPQSGGCVNLSRSNMGTPVFHMYGGVIRNFQASQYGGAVYVASTFSGKKPSFFICMEVQLKIVMHQKELLFM